MPRRKRPARKRTLTELFIKKVKPEKSRVLIWDLKQHGLVLVVLAASVKLFNLQGRIPYAHGKKTPTPSFIAVLRLQVLVAKAQNLKTIGITDDPEIQLVPFPVVCRNLNEARKTSLLLDGSIDAR